MKVFVTGSEGSLMQAVIPRLLMKNCDVVGIDNLCRYGERRTTETRYTFVQMDLTDRKGVDELFARHKPDYVIQAAARIYGIGGFNKYCADILGEDLTLHTNVLRSSVENKVKRVVYISSSMVYETCVQDIDTPVTEDLIDDAIVPKTEYGLSKFVGERLSRAYYKQYGLEYTIWRPFNIITPYETAENEMGISHVFADFIKKIIIEKKTTLDIIGDGNQIRCFTWIDEIAQAIADYSFVIKAKNQSVNLGNPEPISMRYLAKLIHDVGKELEILTSDTITFNTKISYENDVKVRVPSVEKAKDLFDWRAKQKVRESIRKCVQTMMRES